MNDSRRKWLTREVFLISFSAFFADLGYQAIVGLFPIVVRFLLRQPAYVFGFLMALTYGIGSLVSYAGGRLGDKYSKKKLAIGGNLLITLLSASGLPGNIAESSALYLGGWWSRDFRSPVRRAMLVEVSDPGYTKKIFGFLHSLDVGGGMISTIIAFLLLYSGFGVPTVMLVMVVPILVSSVCLSLVREGRHEKFINAPPVSAADAVTNASSMKLFLMSAGLFGFSYYSLGFPIITVADATHSYALGLLSYTVFLGVSGITGYILGSSRLKAASGLWKLGYSVSALGSLFIGLSYQYHLGLPAFYLSIATLGFGTGSIETFEPVVASILSPSARISRGMGSLSAWRGIGLFSSNLLMGLLFTFSVLDSYLYAFLTASAAAFIMWFVQRRTSFLRDKSFS
ncbi:MAG: MFS transporter [Thermoplasmata archaeon]|nr:MFS transporter [Candidatus Sysuiplasma acidicola]